MYPNELRGIYIMATDPKTKKITGHIIFYPNSQPRVLKFNRATLSKVIERAEAVIHESPIYRLTNN